jgi:hypothetical protein
MPDVFMTRDQCLQSLQQDNIKHWREFDGADVENPMSATSDFL